jgi:hypothetical protein
MYLPTASSPLIQTVTLKFFQCNILLITVIEINKNEPSDYYSF